MEPVTITYFDTAMVLIEIGPIRLLTDPVFDDAGSTFDLPSMVPKEPRIVERYAPIGIAVFHLGYVEVEMMKGLHLSLSAKKAVT